ncbi:endonuclease/exonuclease/phosphatase family protein [Streptomyces sp. NPDC046805]|uniref:endonuclease/exonuclease/phosphatase family protein n=1 Tax=Streptomyces sp. NPDC046805 TaxID=3155134 RepID=UPI0033C7F2B4
MTRRLRLVVTAILAAVTAVVALAAPPAMADTAVPPSSAGQRWALKVHGYYVTVDAGATGDMKLRANPNATTPQGWEKFTLHTDHIPGVGYGTTVSFRSEATGKYVTAEDAASGSLLRTRGDNTGAWERFKLQPLADGTFALLADNGNYVAAELGSYPDYGLLRARTSTSAPSTLGSWERFTLERVGPEGAYSSDMPATSTQAPRSQDVVSWNICSNNNDAPDCRLVYAPPATVASEVSSALHNAMGSRRPDAIFFQEICEKSAKPLELALEDWAGPLDVRFMPTYYTVATAADGSAIRAQKNCSDGSDHADRGAFGIALAVPDSNTWYQGTVLPSPDGKEQRPMLCAVVPSVGSAYCNAHFSSGPYIDSNGNPAGDDTDPKNPYRPKQAAEMRDQVDYFTPNGYTTYYGGDLNTTTADVAYLNSLYDGHQECGQQDPASPHTGDPTDGGNKIDYIFGPQGLNYACSVADGGLSDHRMIHLRTS